MAIYSKAEVANKFGISKAAIHKAIHAGRLIAVEVDGKMVINSSYPLNRLQFENWLSIQEERLFPEIAELDLDEEVELTPEEKRKLAQINELKELDLELKRLDVENKRLHLKAVKDESIPTELIRLLLKDLSDSLKKNYKIKTQDFFSENLQTIGAEECLSKTMLFENELLIAKIYTDVLTQINLRLDNIVEDSKTKG